MIHQVHTAPLLFNYILLKNQKTVSPDIVTSRLCKYFLYALIASSFSSLNAITEMAGFVYANNYWEVQYVLHYLAVRFNRILFLCFKI